MEIISCIMTECEEYRPAYAAFCAYFKYAITFLVSQLAGGKTKATLLPPEAMDKNSCSKQLSYEIIISHSAMIKLQPLCLNYQYSLPGPIRLDTYHEIVQYI